MKKTIAVSGVKSILETKGALQGYMFAGGYTITSGGASILSAYTNKTRLAEIDELESEVSAKAFESVLDVFNRYNGIFHEGVEGSYQPPIVKGIAELCSIIRKDSPQRASLIIQGLVEVMPSFENKTALDLGSNMGYVSISLEACGMDVLGIDQYTRYLEFAVAVAKAIKSCARFLDADIEAVVEERATLGVQDSVVVFLNILHHLVAKRKWNEQQCKEFVLKLLSISTDALVIGFPPDQIPHMRDMTLDLTDWVSSECSLSFLGNSPRPIWICNKN